jgi:hypothetical protein
VEFKPWSVPRLRGRLSAFGISQRGDRRLGKYQTLKVGLPTTVGRALLSPGFWLLAPFFEFPQPLEPVLGRADINDVHRVTGFI